MPLQVDNQKELVKTLTLFTKWTDTKYDDFHKQVFITQQLSRSEIAVQKLQKPKNQNHAL